MPYVIGLVPTPTVEEHSHVDVVRGEETMFACKDCFVVGRKRTHFSKTYAKRHFEETRKSLGLVAKKWIACKDGNVIRRRMGEALWLTDAMGDYIRDELHAWTRQERMSE